MKTILIATDFSAASKNAAFYGVHLAKHLPAKIVLLNVYPKVKASKVLPFLKNRKEDLRLESKFKLKAEIRYLDVPEGTQIIKRCEEGNPAEVILNIAKEINASWIIAGVKGISKLELNLFGSIALQLSRTSTIPLMLIPEDAGFKQPLAMALASNLGDEQDMQVLDPLKDLGECFKSKMHIVKVIKKAMNDLDEQQAKPNRLNWHLRNLYPDFEFLADHDVTHALNKFVHDHEIDVIAMTTQEHTLFENLFVKSNIKAMMLQTQIPLIILPGTTVHKYPGNSEPAIAGNILAFPT